MQLNTQTRNTDTHARARTTASHIEGFFLVEAAEAAAGSGRWWYRLLVGGRGLLVVGLLVVSLLVMGLLVVSLLVGLLVVGRLLGSG